MSPRPLPRPRDGAHLAAIARTPRGRWRIMGELGIMKGSPVIRRFLRAAGGTAALTLLAACDVDTAYEAVPYRVQDELPAAANPAPPRVNATVLAAATGGGGQVIAASLPAGVTQEMVDEGQKLYGTACVACHASGGAGSPAAPALNDGDWLHITGDYPEITNIITVGVGQPKQYPGAMPARGGGNFTDEQVRAIAAYVYALSHPAES